MSRTLRSILCLSAGIATTIIPIWAANHQAPTASIGMLAGSLLAAAIVALYERNTRPPKPDLKTFINRNTKGDQR